MTQQPPSTANFLFKREDTGPAVADIRSRLVALRLLPDDPRAQTPDDAVFDTAMEDAVRHFQQDRALTADGVVGPETFRHLEEARWRLGDRLLAHSVSHPMVGDDIARLQQRLLDMGFVPGRVDGIYGPDTAQAVREFQRNTGLRPDGTCGPATFTVLARLTRTVVGGHPHVMRESEELRRSGPSLAGKVLVLDPGHGGDDPGATCHGLREADVMWDLVNRLEGRLTALGVRTYLTRSQHTGGTEADRARFANATEADLAVSLHTDSHPNPRAHGVSAYYYGYDRHGRWSHTGRSFAGFARREIVARCGFGDNRSHGKTWTLLRTTRMPTVRLDLGYLSNPDDAARLASAEAQTLIVESIAVALQRLYLPPEDDAPTGVLNLPLRLTAPPTMDEATS
ncbi:N-acetylmuramoyl-L-alanine amidase [Wenjunlia vitaminophila]|uniref:N-acetylmuramoyl-L-alanine amidase n=1 Tax=Wenjunlia vitaminophila TaxID=76728 RepID=UPI000376091D|nr:N-acetylmuramoyl-L-alanine amidase [Wenjunlia vitaminophila]